MTTAWDTPVSNRHSSGPTTSADSSEIDLDNYATLFSPGTPHASPTIEGGSLCPLLSGAASHVRHQSTASLDSDFGAFVSVPPTEDPLAANNAGFPPDSPISPQARPKSWAFEEKKSNHPANATLEFFDKFARDAKLASERNKKGLLDELLLNDEDPHAFLKDSSTLTTLNTKNSVPDTSDNVVSSSDAPTSIASLASSSASVPPALPPLLSDVDADYFSSRPTPQPSVPHSPMHSIHASARHSPTRSPTLPGPSTLAPPISSSPTITRLDPSDYDPLSENSTWTSFAGLPSSHQTLSNLSSKFSLLLRSSEGSPRHSSRTSPESLFSAFEGSNPRPSDAHKSSSTPSIGRASSRLPHAHTIAVGQTQSSRFNPFMPSSHGTPFASHIYTPPSGAPGFKGEEYDWDKGFSKDLERDIPEFDDERELINVTAQEGIAQDLANIDGLPTHKRSHRKEGSMADRIEKRLGSIQFQARNASTSKIMTVELADLLRAYLPALARLPRIWTLLYSLDQHGISLNTLYSRCEAQTKVKPGAVGAAGALLAIKDSEGALFGAWVSEGIHLSKGKGYYGSGESFLWRFQNERLNVFKWTGRNEYVALCEPGFLSFGGGDGHYGLYLDDGLLDGSSAPCPTFNNDILCTPGPKKAGTVEFECVGLEVWGVGP